MSEAPDCRPGAADVTVVLVSRNRAGQLRLVLPAIAANTVPPAEVLLADDASTDDTVEVFEQLCRQLKLPGRALRHPAGAVSFRINSMRNAGLRQCRTGRAILLDADHVPATTHIEAHMRMLDRGQKALSTGPRLEAANADGSGPVNFMWGHESYSSMSPEPDKPLPFWGLVPGSNLGMHRDFADRLGLYDEQYDGGYGYDDQDFNCRANRAGAVYYGDFRAYVIHLPHGAASGARDGSRNAALFLEKNGVNLDYPLFVTLTNYLDNWAKRYAKFTSGQDMSERENINSWPPPEPGERCKAATKWASTHVGGRFLMSLAMKKLLARMGLGRKP